jgi:cell division septation protein DedD
MTRRPFDPRETGSEAGELDPVTDELERYAHLTEGEVPHGLADRVMARVAQEPTPRRGLLAWLLAPFVAGPGGAAQVVLVAGTMALAVLAVVLAGQLGELFGNRQIGTSPSPTVIESPSLTPTPSASPSATPSPSPSLSPTPSPSPSSAAPVVTPSPSDDDEPETPEPTDDDDDGETPEPSDDDNSGPGGGGGDDSD